MNLNEARGQIAEKSAHLEGAMRNAGAEGKGLKDLSSSLGGFFDESQRACVKRIYQFRNKVMHDVEFRFTESRFNDFLSDADSIIRLLMTRDEFPRKGETPPARMNTTSYAGETYQQAPTEGEQRYRPILNTATHRGTADVEIAAEPIRATTSKPKLLSKEQRDALNFDNTPPEPREVKPPKRSILSSELKQDLREAGKDLAVKAVVGSVLKILKII